MATAELRIDKIECIDKTIDMYLTLINDKSGDAYLTDEVVRANAMLICKNNILHDNMLHGYRIRYFYREATGRLAGSVEATTAICKNIGATP